MNSFSQRLRQAEKDTGKRAGELDAAVQELQEKVRRELQQQRKEFDQIADEFDQLRRGEAT
jgi:uncharacterized membrane protein